MPTLLVVHERQVLGRHEGRATGPGHRGSHPPACPPRRLALTSPPIAAPARTDRAATRGESLTRRSWTVLRAGPSPRRASDDITTTAQALAYSFFLAIPSLFLVVLGVFSLVASPTDVERLIDRARRAYMPPEAATLLGDSLQRSIAVARAPASRSSIVGFVLALWSTTSAATTLMKAVTGGVRPRGRPRLRAQAPARAGARRLLPRARRCSSSGCSCSGRSSSAGSATPSARPTATAWVWWTAQWPLLAGALLFLFAVAALPRPRRPAAALEAGHARRRRVARDLARRLGRVRVLHRAFRLLQQDVGDALGGRDHADLALAHEPRAAVRRGGQRGRAARAGRRPRRAPTPSAPGRSRLAAPASTLDARADDRAAGAAAARAARSRS